MVVTSFTEEEEFYSNIHAGIRQQLTNSMPNLHVKGLLADCIRMYRTPNCAMK